jgi:hypothetical protein
MFAKSIAVFISTLVLFSLQVNAHAIINPAIGVTGTPSRNDVQRPSAANGCGNVNVASVLGTSTAVPVSANGTFNVTVQNFNQGEDGSREIATALVDTTATGKSFPVTANITKNGIKNPTDDTSQEIDVSFPAGTTCTGGASGNECLVSFTTDSGFGNCVLVSQAATGAAAKPITVNNAAQQPAAGGKKPCKHQMAVRYLHHGTRAPRALLAALKKREAERFT